MDSDEMFAITPMSRKLNLKAGESYTDYIVVSNPQSATRDFAYRIKITGYSVLADGSSMEFSTEGERTKIVEWITFEKDSGVIPPNGQEIIYYTINVPADAAPGGQYAAILVSSDSEKNNTSGVNIQNDYEMASILYAQVEGEVQRGGEILINEVPGFVTAMPPISTVSLQNTGNIHETATIVLTIKNVITGEIVFPREGQDQTAEEIVMPETTRLVQRELEAINMIGIYEVDQDITFLGSRSDITRVMVVCPVWFIVAVIVAILLMGVGITHFVRRRRTKKYIY